ncbi:GIY-YIG nuclease family protein [Patescibacteria group bacterium]|nr:GIY-YIG nuclease family protein [Patescibacteria group bacterium]MBU1029259.1 GIY-YIG nuclease family protein [Patescibacteria group bacterium]MBU1915916.1 GIY-YIG nuclease family protein [Patescibacteria group bacterium]
MFWAIKKTKSEPEQDIILPEHWHTYIVRCLDGSLYTGITSDIDETLHQMNQGTGPTYTHTRYPVFLVHCEEFMNEIDAEHRAESIRRLNRQAKEVLLSELLVGALEA